MNISVEQKLVWPQSQIASVDYVPEIPPDQDYWRTPSPLMAAALDNPLSGLIVFDRDLRVVHVTSQLHNILGVPPTSFSAGNTVLDLFKLADLNAVELTSAKVAVFNEAGAPEPVLLKVDGTGLPVSMKIRPLGSCYRLAAFERVPGESGSTGQTYASRDALTKLMSRSAFESAVGDILAKDSSLPFAIFLLDLDRFKPVNDSLGHAAGDTVLRLVSKRLQAAVKQSDLVARFGGDEFAILSQNAASDVEPSAIAHRILDVLQRTYLANGQLVNIGASIGIAMSPQNGANCAELLRSADLALYNSKTTGRGTFHFFEPQMATRAELRRTNELELRRALALRQLEVHYQPQVQLSSGKLIGFEALVRWRHPERGLVPPNDFLPLAEEIGLIVPLGDWVLRTACQEALQWDPSVTVAVNASPLQFDAGHFAESVAGALESTGLPGNRLEIEITEGILLRSEDAIQETLSKLRGMGVRIAMDDFGTGYASLSQLARFPFDKIKIDRSLAGNAGDHPKNRAIVRAIASLGASLGVPTMAEGVESDDQLDRLAADGCSSVQGYLFSKPIPANEIKSLIAKLSAQTHTKLYGDHKLYEH